MSNSLDPTPQQGAAPARRTIVAGAAWSLPVLATAIAVPAAAASNTGVILFAAPEYSTAPNGSLTTIAGTVTPGPGQPLPNEVALSYPPGFTGPATASVNAQGEFVVGLVTAPGAPTTGTLVASATGFTDGATELVVEVNIIPGGGDGIVWGENLSNTLFVAGGGNLLYARTPNFISSGEDLSAGRIIAMAGGYRGANSYLIRDDNTLWSHGDGSNATAPGTTGTSAGRFDFGTQLGADEKLVSIAGFTGGGYVLTSLGRVFSWGFNTGLGSLGNGTTGPDTKSPKLVTFPAGTFITQISASYTGGIALDSTGRVWAWGVNDQNDTGTQSTGSVLTPKRVVFQDGTPISGVSQVRGRFKGGLALVGDRVLSWGTNSGGQLANGSTSGTRGYADWVLTAANTPLTGIVKLPVFYHEAYHSAALSGSGQLYTWGYGSYNVHTPDNTSSRPYAAVYGGTLPSGTVVDVSLTYYGIHVLLSDGTVWSWGDNDYGIAANGTSGGIVKNPTQALSGPGQPVQASGFFPGSHGGTIARA